MQAKNRKEPAYSVVTALGGVRSTASLLDIDPSAVSRWMTDKKRGGSGGVIPQRYWASILRHAKYSKLDISLTDLAAL
jgi:hypothetical protein